MNRGDGSYNRLLSQADDVADRVLRATKAYLPHVARFCLVATFIDDGLRMWFQWPEQKDYVSLTWGCGDALGHLFVLLNMLLQLAGCGMVLIRKYVPVAVGMLFSVILIQVRGLFFFLGVCDRLLCGVLYFGWCPFCENCVCLSFQTFTYTVLWDFKFFMR